MATTLNWQEHIRVFIREWLWSLGNDIVATARKLNKKKSVSIWHFVSVDRLYVTAEGPAGDYPHPNLEQWAFDFTFTVPPDGYQPQPGSRSIRMEKWEGIKYVKATYTKFKGQTITRKGFIDEAVRKELTQQRLNALGLGLAAMVGRQIAEQIADELRKGGANVTIT